MSLQLTVMSLDFDSLTPPLTKSFGKKEITIGRLPTNDLVLDTPEVSAHHAKLRIVTSGEKTRLFITDLGSTNGTLVENIPLADRVEIPLAANERVRIGNYLLKPIILSDGDFETEEAVLTEKTYPEFKRNTEEIKPAALSSLREQTLVMEKSELLKPLAEKPTEINGHHSLANPEPAHLVALAKAASAAAVEPSIETTLEEKKPESTEILAAPATPEKSDVEKKSNSTFAAIITGKVGVKAPLTFNFTATQLFTLSGKISHKGTPLAGVAIDGGALGVSMTDSHGVFTFSDITEGTPYDIKASKAEFRITGSATGRLSKSEELKFEALQLFTVSGKITHQGKPLAGVVVDGGPLGKTTTESDGSYTFKDVLEDTEFNLTVEKEGFRFTTA